MGDGYSPETMAAQALGTIDQASGAVSPPIHPSTIYELHADGTSRAGLAYTRADNPTYDHAEQLLTALERGDGCMLFASGSAAATAVFQSLLPGDHVLVPPVGRESLPALDADRTVEGQKSELRETRPS